MILINGEHYASGFQIAMKKRASTWLLTAYQWCGHQSSAAEGPIAEVRIVRATPEECVVELRHRWLSLAGQTKYVGFGGQFRHVGYYSAATVNEAIDALKNALEEASATVA